MASNDKGLMGFAFTAALFPANRTAVTGEIPSCNDSSARYGLTLSAGAGFGGYT